MWSILLAGATAFAPPLAAVRPTHTFVPRMPRSYAMDFGGESDYVDTTVYNYVDGPKVIQPATQLLSQEDAGVGWVFAAVLGLGVGYKAISSLSVGGREAQYAAELVEELGEVELEAAEKVEDSQKRKSNVDAKTTAELREQRRELKTTSDPVATELKQKRAEQEKWDAKKAKWERKADAVAETVEMDDEDGDVN